MIISKELKKIWMKRLSMLILGFVFLQNHVIKADDIIPMSPNASSLAMYADYPVSYYTGIPEINIPLYEINVDGFKLPISLSYHSNGILYNQEASWVGLGWTLNTGGAISRTIRDADDFMFGSSNNSKTGCYLSNADLSNPDPNNKNMFYKSLSVCYCHSYIQTY